MNNARTVGAELTPTPPGQIDPHPPGGFDPQVGAELTPLTIHRTCEVERSLTHYVRKTPGAGTVRSLLCGGNHAAFL